MRGMKKILVLMLLCTTVVGTSKTNPTLTTLKWKSSEILSDSEGKRLPYIKPHKLFPKIKMNYIEDRIFEIRQVDDNSFLVLGSPIDWESNYVKWYSILDSSSTNHNISRVIHNIALLLYYNTLKTSSKVGEWLREHKESYKQSLRYVDEPRYIKRDYEDPYEIEDYESQSGDRNRYGFPKIN